MIPEVGATPHSEVAELWGCVHAVASVAATPGLQGVGVRCDCDSAVLLLGGVDGRPHPRHEEFKRRVKKHPARDIIDQARRTVADVLIKHGLLLRATHVHGHGWAGEPAQRAFNGGADYLARVKAIETNRGGGRG